MIAAIGWCQCFFLEWGSAAGAGLTRNIGKLQEAGCGRGLQAAVCRAHGSMEEYFGLETEATRRYFLPSCSTSEAATSAFGPWGASFPYSLRCFTASSIKFIPSRIMPN